MLADAPWAISRRIVSKSAGRIMVSDADREDAILAKGSEWGTVVQRDAPGPVSRREVEAVPEHPHLKPQDHDRDERAPAGFCVRALLAGIDRNRVAFGFLPAHSS